MTDCELMPIDEKAPIGLRQLVEENGPEEKLPLGHFFRKDSSFAKCVRREVAVAG